MRPLIEALVREQLSPLLERIEQLSDEIEELRRRQQLMIRLGKVSARHSSNKLIKIKHGELETPFIKWFAQAAGKVSHYRCPSVGEQVLLLNFGAGNNSQQSIALVGIDSSQFPFVSDNPEQVVTLYGDKCAEIWDMVQGTLTLKAKQKIILDSKLVQASKDIKAEGEITDHIRSMQADRTIYNGHDHPHGIPLTGKVNQTQ